jgi:hypothetical protein
MHIAKPTHAKKGGKSNKKPKQKDFNETKQKAVAELMNNIEAEAKSIEQEAVKQILERHLGRPLAPEDVPKIERLHNEHGYALIYDNVPLGLISRHNHVDQKEENNFKVEFQPYE